MARLRDPALLDETLSAAERGALDAFAAAARRECGPRLARLAVFGSRARGDEDEASDIDVLAVVTADADLLRGRLRRIAAEINVARDTDLSVHVLAEEALADLARRERRFAADIAREAIDL